MREVFWVGSSLDDLREFPAAVRREMGYALHLAENGETHPNVKPLKGVHGAGVLEMAEDFDGDTYRAVYALTLPDAVYVLHAFQKKSKQGIATPKRDFDLIRKRLKWAQDQHAARRAAAERTGR